MPQQELDDAVAAALPGQIAAFGVQAAVVEDPFASPGQPMTMHSAKSAMDDAFRQGTPPVDVPYELPGTKGPPVALLVAIGAIFLVLGGVVVALMMR
jgi:hypothetical protein